MLVGGRVLPLLFLRPLSTPVPGIRCLASVSGVIYSAAESAPTVKLFTKEGCTLCDKAKDVLKEAMDEFPHTLEAVDITDADNAEWFSKYKYDIPVLHVNGQYWAKHRITIDEARQALGAAKEQGFVPSKGEPDAGRLERKRTGPLKN